MLMPVTAGSGYPKAYLSSSILQRRSLFSAISWGDYAYLEEDVDLSTFLKAMRQRGIEPEFREYHAEYSRIRGYESYHYEPLLPKTYV